MNDGSAILSRFRELHVLARNTTFQYKGQAVDVATVGRKLRAQYVLEGSVRKAGDRVRITAQLIDVLTGSHIWADRYDRQLEDIFTLQDEITGRVVGAIAGSGGAVRLAERRAAERKTPEQLEAYDLVLRATAIVPGTVEAYRQCKDLLERAISVDPQYARARQEYAWLVLRGLAHRQETARELLPQAKQNAIRSVELDPSDAFTHRTAAWGYFFDHQLDLFAREAKIALELAPYNAEVLAQLGMLTAFTGQWERGLELVRRAYALNEISAAGFYHTTVFYDLYLKGECREAIDVIRQHPRQQLTETLLKYVAAYGQLGDREKVREYWSKCVAQTPDFSAEWLRDTLRFWNMPESDNARLADGITKANTLIHGPTAGTHD